MRGLQHLHPEARERAEELQLLCKKNNLPILITETLRTTAEQNELYAKGRTTPGKIVTHAKGDTYQSAHQWGVAFDFCKNIKGQEYSDTAFFKAIGTLGKAIGLFWGGDFKTFVDLPHFELPKYLPNNSTSQLKNKYGTPSKFIAEWTLAQPALYPISQANLAAMSALGIMTSVDYWRGVNVQYLDELLTKACSKCDRSVSNDIIGVDHALEVLVRGGVISSPDYWRRVLNDVKYLDVLLVGIARRVVVR